MTTKCNNGLAIKKALRGELDIYKLIGKYCRPPKLTNEIAAEIAQHLINGMSIVNAAKEVGVSTVAIYYWMQHSEQFANIIARARELRSHTHVEDAADRLANNNNDLYHDGKRIAVNTAQVQRDFRLAEYRYKLAGRFNALYRDDNNNQLNLQLNINQTVDLPPASSRAEWEQRRQAIDITKGN